MMELPGHTKAFVFKKWVYFYMTVLKVNFYFCIYFMITLDGHEYVTGNRQT